MYILFRTTEYFFVMCIIRHLLILAKRASLLLVCDLLAASFLSLGNLLSPMAKSIMS